jgi:flagellar basal-body rod protein FlgG
MFGSLHIAATGMEAQQRKLDVIANNMSNVNTTAFKTSRAEFEEMLYQQVRAPSGAGENAKPTGIEFGLGVKTAATARDFTQGTFENTGNPLDLAIEGTGFFQVIAENGNPAFTRAGLFKLDARGKVVNQSGLEIFPPITVPDEVKSLQIAPDGSVTAILADDDSEIEIGQIELTLFTNPAGLRSLGRNLFAGTQASGSAKVGIPGETSFGTLAQGFLEKSNVEVVEEMVSMIASQRAYEISSKLIRTADEMLRTITNIR